MKEIFTKKGIKVGLLFGGIVVGLNLIVGFLNTFIPVLVFVTWIISAMVWFVLFLGGYSNGFVESFSKESMSDNLKKAVGAGLVAALLIGVAGGVISVLLSLVPRTTGFMGYTYTYSDFTFFGAIASFFGQMLVGLFSGVFWFVVGGIVYAYYPVSNLPSNVVGYFDKVKHFVTK